jgi:2',3'-cyclic-nucleotide 2'-phosphodiesterase (5'-nucleotidase family)
VLTGSSGLHRAAAPGWRIRRAGWRGDTLLKQLAQERGWPVVPLDVGSRPANTGAQFQHTAEALRLMGYRAIALGADDLRLPAGDLLNGTNPPDQTSLFIGANLALLSRDLQPTHVVIEAGGMRIGVTAVLGDEHEQRLQSDELVHAPAVESLQSVSTKLREAQCDLYVLLAHAPLAEARKIAAEVPLFDLVVVAGQTMHRQ